MSGSLKIVAKRRLTPIYRPVISAFRRVTWMQRASPEIIIVGAQKAGTTSLFNYLSQHPQLAPSFKKEVHYFDGGLREQVDNFTRGKAWYRSNFPLRAKKRKAFEASPFYLYHPMAAGRIYSYAPEIRLIVLLRNPTDRAISHYFHEARRGTELLPIKEALELEEERIKPMLDNGDYNNEWLNVYSYKSRGRYYEQLKVYLKYFDWKNILLLDSASLFSQPESVLREVYDFVEIDNNFVAKDLIPMNVGDNKSTVPDGVRDYLDEYFKHPNKNLYELTGKDYKWSCR